MVAGDRPPTIPHLSPGCLGYAIDRLVLIAVDIQKTGQERYASTNYACTQRDPHCVRVARNVDLVESFEIPNSQLIHVPQEHVRFLVGYSDPDTATNEC